MSEPKYFPLSEENIPRKKIEDPLVHCLTADKLFLQSAS
jgi:hypothetical protein